MKSECFPPIPLHPKTTDGSRREEGAEGPHLPHGLVPVAPEALADALHAELELLEAVVPDHPAVVGLLARRGRDEVLGCKTGRAMRGQALLGGHSTTTAPVPHRPPSCTPRGTCQSTADTRATPALQNLLLPGLFPSSHPWDPAPSQVPGADQSVIQEMPGNS